MKYFSKEFYDFTYKVKEPTTVRAFLKKVGFSSRFTREISLGFGVYVNRMLSITNGPLYPGDVVGVVLPEEKSSVTPYPKGIDIYYEDSDYIVLRKPSGISTHPAPGTGPDTLSSRLAHYYRQTDQKRKIRPVTRLDKDTSGLVVFAKHSPAQEHLQRQQRSGRFIKKYVAKTMEAPLQRQGRIEENILWDQESQMAQIDDKGKVAITEYEVFPKDDGYVWKCTLLTGRTHQIRIHLQHLGCPIVGDKKYQGILGEKMELHCYYVSFVGWGGEKEIAIYAVPKDEGLCMGKN